MTQSVKKGWFHCGSCGSLFESIYGSGVARVCTECGKIAGIVTKESSPRITDTERGSVPNQIGFEKQPEFLIDDSGRRAVRKKRSANMMMKIVLAWTVILLLAVWMRTRGTRATVEKEELEQVASRMTKGTLADEDIALLNEALPDCHRTLGGFLTAGTPEGRNQFVVDPIETAGKMATFYSYNPLHRVQVEGLQRIDQELLRVGNSWMILTRWKDTNGIEFDVLFSRNSGKWRLDWNHFSQYSGYPWTLFLAGEGPDEAEFRLLARQRLSDSDSEKVGSRLIFTMCTPGFGNSGDIGMESPDFVIDRQSEEGLLIRAAFADCAADRRLFGQEMKNPEGAELIRLHVRVKRSEFGGKRTFNLEKIISCHWIDCAEVGYDLAALQADLFGN